MKKQIHYKTLIR